MSRWDIDASWLGVSARSCASGQRQRGVFRRNEPAPKLLCLNRRLIVSGVGGSLASIGVDCRKPRHAVQSDLQYPNQI